MEQAATSRRYVVLHHQGIPEPHFDWMIEAEPGGALMTWRCPTWPIEREATLTRLADHRRAYLDYEGPVSGNRGFVRRIEAGECVIQQNNSRWRVSLLTQEIELQPAHGDRWLATVQADPRQAG